MFTARVCLSVCYHMLAYWFTAVQDSVE